MKELKDSKDLISSYCYHHFHHLSAKSEREKKSFTLFQAIMNICQNMCDDFFFANTAGLFYDKNFPSRNNDLSQKNKGVLYSGIDKKTRDGSNYV